MSSLEHHLYILSNGRVAAISRNTGEIVWEVKLKKLLGSSMIRAIGQIRLEGDKLFIGIAGHIACLRVNDGSLVWKNELKGWGYQFVSMSGADNEEAAATTQQRQAAAASGAAAS